MADQPTIATYTPGPLLQWSSAGGGASVTRASTGVYAVYFASAAGIHGGNVQVTAVGADATYCKAGGWFADVLPGGSSPTTERVSVVCFNGGVPADSAFVVSFGADYPASGQDAYVLYAPPAPPLPVTVSPAAYYASNVSSIYTPTDRVMLSIPSVSSLPMEHVTAMGTGPEQCSFNTTGISCFDVSGARVESAFSYVKGLGSVNPSGLSGAYVTFDQPWSSVTTVTPSAQGGDWAGATKSITVTRLSMGQYEVLIPGAGVALAHPSMVHVTAYDVQRPQGIPAYCKTGGWSAPVGGTDLTIKVGCYWLKTGAVGTPADHGFHVSFLAAVPRYVVPGALRAPRKP